MKRRSGLFFVNKLLAAITSYALSLGRLPGYTGHSVGPDGTYNQVNINYNEWER